MRNAIRTKGRRDSKPIEKRERTLNEGQNNRERETRFFFFFLTPLSLPFVISFSFVSTTATGNGCAKSKCVGYYFKQCKAGINSYRDSKLSSRRHMRDIFARNRQNLTLSSIIRTEISDDINTRKSASRYRGLSR
ncbi:hypothetical protein PUN28_015703 [Cardiocondyla obscurior]|uniref:Uncharacterized protein n=1 Tax=Cardiocondyla obscurior TaxID=286306 RepID=A0AAW2EWN0_9HYME